MMSHPFVSLSDLERETGFGKDQIRKWRQRFGFPLLEPALDGKSTYSRKTVSQLLVIKRLLEAGFRPRQVVGKSASELNRLHLALCPPGPNGARDTSAAVFIERLRQSDMAGFGSSLAEERAKRTLAEFVRYTVAPLLIGMGDAWARDEIGIHHEHLGTSYIERYLHAQILTLKPKPGLPSILFARPPLEQHFLGLLMMEAVLAEQGARTINIGSGLPSNNLKLAAISCRADVVALSFSVAYPEHRVAPALLQLRRLLPIQIQIWAGGAGVAVLRKSPKGVRIILDIEDAVVAISDWVQPAGLDDPEV